MANHRQAFRTASYWLGHDPEDFKEGASVEGTPSPLTIQQLFQRFSAQPPDDDQPQAPRPPEPAPELCLRFTIEAVDEGTNDPTCISEIVPLLGCQ